VCVCACVRAGPVCSLLFIHFHTTVPILTKFDMMIKDFPGEVLGTWICAWLKITVCRVRIVA
jgi:hypothetical protein